MTMKTPRARWHLATANIVERLEDATYIVVAALLAIAGLFLLWSAASTLVVDLLRARSPISVVLDVLDKGLVLFIIAELLHTVRITLVERTLVAEPFLIVGLIAGIRRVLILTAQAAENPQTFRWNPVGIELALLTGLVLAMTVSLVLWRRLYLGVGEIEHSSAAAEKAIDGSAG